MIVTLDTAILVRATARSNGPARALLELLVNEPGHSIVVSRYILSEVGKTLCYSNLYNELKLTPDDVGRYLEYLTEVVDLVEPIQGLPVVLGDPKDDPVIYTAIAASADVLCTRDKKFFAPNAIVFAEKYDLVIMDEHPLLSRLRNGKGSE